MFVVVGRVKDAHGIKGEIFVRVHSGDTVWLESLHEVRLNSSGNIQSFEIERARRHKDGIVFQLTGVINRNHAEKLKGYDFEVPEELLIAEVGDRPFLREILGFEVIDQRLGSIGLINDFSSNGAQDLLVIKYKNKEVLVPFVESFVLNMDFEKRQIQMNLPSGLVD